jgi:hypothetical protein
MFYVSFQNFKSNKVGLFSEMVNSGMVVLAGREKTDADGL